jgi:hypothetical protein
VKLKQHPLNSITKSVVLQIADDFCLHVVTIVKSGSIDISGQEETESITTFVVDWKL